MKKLQLSCNTGKFLFGDTVPIGKGGVSRGDADSLIKKGLAKEVEVKEKGAGVNPLEAELTETQTRLTKAEGDLVKANEALVAEKEKTKALELKVEKLKNK